MKHDTAMASSTMTIMTAHNDITGDALKSKSPTDSYRDGWDRIFGKKAQEQEPAAEAAVVEGERTYIARQQRDIVNAHSVDDAAEVINENGAVQRIDGINILFKATELNALQIGQSLYGWLIAPEQFYALPDARRRASK